VAFVRTRQIWLAANRRRRNSRSRPFTRDGTSESPAWSPDGRTIAFVSSRNDHSFIGLFTPSSRFGSWPPRHPETHDPSGSPDGKRIAFLRLGLAPAGAPHRPAVGTYGASAVVDSGRRCRVGVRDKPQRCACRHGITRRPHAGRSDPGRTRAASVCSGGRRFPCLTSRIGRLPTPLFDSTSRPFWAGGSKPTLLTPGSLHGRTGHADAPIDASPSTTRIREPIRATSIGVISSRCR